MGRQQLQLLFSAEADLDVDGKPLKVFRLRVGVALLVEQNLSRAPDALEAAPKLAVDLAQNAPQLGQPPGLNRAEVRLTFAATISRP